MTIRHWAMATLVAGVFLLLPGAVFANGNSHHSIHGKSHHGEGQSNRQQDTREPVKDHGESGESKKDGLVNQNQSHPNQGQEHAEGQSPVSGDQPEKQHSASGNRDHTGQKNHTPGNPAQKRNPAAGHSSKKQRSDSENRDNEAAEHASEQAKQHAADQSAVHEAADQIEENNKKHNDHDKKKVERSIRPIHNHSAERVKDQVQKEMKSRQSVRLPEQRAQDDAVLSKDKPRTPHQKVSKKGQPSGQAEKSEPISRSSRDSGSKDVPDPVAVVTLNWVGSGSGSHPHPQKSQDSYSPGFSFGIAPEWHQLDKFSTRSFISRRSQYGSQWINAPPAPPPKNAPLF